MYILQVRVGGVWLTRQSFHSKEYAIKRARIASNFGSVSRVVHRDTVVAMFEYGSVYVV